MEKKTLLYLPHELIIQILLRLPVKSLIRFKCVCRSWFSLISDPHFANSHFEFTSSTHTRRIMCLSISSHQIQSIDFDAFLNYDPASVNIHFSLPQSYFPVDIRGSCRGFIFLSCHSHIYLWNPSTGFKKQIPFSPFDSELVIDRLDYIYGFGYDQSSDDYLVVSLFYDANLVKSHLAFFSLRDNTWKEIDGTHFSYVGNAVDSHREGSLVNGAIHWLAVRGDGDVHWDVIVTFDLMERKLFEIPLPSDFDDEAIGHSSLWVFGEFLSLWAKDYDNNTIVIWVMKEYKVQSSWTKTHVLPIDRYFHPIYYTKNADIIGRNRGTGLVKYNDEGQPLRYRSFSNNNNPSRVVMYTESLLSLPGDDEQV